MTTFWIDFLLILLRWRRWWWCIMQHDIWRNLHFFRRLNQNSVAFSVAQAQQKRPSSIWSLVSASYLWEHAHTPHIRRFGSTSYREPFYKLYFVSEELSSSLRLPAVVLNGNSTFSKYLFSKSFNSSPLDPYIWYNRSKVSLKNRPWTTTCF